MVEWLADHGAEINCTNKAGQTSLYLAAKNNHVDIVDQLVKRKGVDVNCGTYWESPLDVAVKNGYFDMGEQLVDYGADCEGMKKRDALLMCAVIAGSIPDVKWLVEHGADVNCKVESGYDRGFTPLYLADMRHNMKVVQYLKAHGTVK